MAERASKIRICSLNNFINIWYNDYISDTNEDRGGPGETLQVYREAMTLLLAAVREAQPSVTDDAANDADSKWDDSDAGTSSADQPKDTMNEQSVIQRGQKIEEKTESCGNGQQTGSDDAHFLLANFLQAENDNYTVFSYVSGINNEVSFKIIIIVIIYEA